MFLIRKATDLTVGTCFVGVNIVYHVKHCLQHSLNSQCYLVNLTRSISYFRRQSSSKLNSCTLPPPTHVHYLPKVNVTVCFFSVHFVRVNPVVEWNTSSWFMLLLV